MRQPVKIRPTIPFAEYKKWFFQYLGSFSLQDSETRHAWGAKIEHSIRVSENCKTIAESLHLKADAWQLVVLIGLFHDIGRFRQILKFSTFSDLKSEDHALLGIDIIREEGLFSEMPDTTRKIIESAIWDHNKTAISSNADNTVILFSKILRDADKLDILRLVTEYYLHPDKRRNEMIELDLPDKPGVSDLVVDEIFQRKMVQRSSMRTADDFKILQMSWIYDIHFPITFRTIFEQKYVEKLRSVLPDSPEVDKIVEQVLSDLNEKMSG